MRTGTARRVGSSAAVPALGSVDRDEMFRTFNMGIGLIVVIPAEMAKKATAVFNRASERHCVIGRIARGEKRVHYA